MSNVSTGRIIRTTKFKERFDGVYVDRVVDKKLHAVCLVLATLPEDKTYDPVALDESLMGLGWFKTADILEHFGDEKCREFMAFLLEKYKPKFEEEPKSKLILVP